jgi:glycosyltransferase involved in cell wall biosynthesis
MTRPTLTVTLPNYNHAKFLPRAIDEILSQSHPPDEFLILDDASTDGSARIIESYASRHPTIRFVRNAKNLGVIRANARLFELATGDYIYSGAADDSRRPEFFARAMQMAERHPEAGIVFGEMLSVDEAGRELGHIRVPTWREPLYATPERLLKEYLDAVEPSHSLCGATIYKRRAFAEVGWYRPELGSWADTFAARAIALKYGACYVPEVFAAWTCQSGSFSHAARVDPYKTIDLVDRAAWLMGSPEFRDRFPEAHVRDWRSRYVRRIAREYRQGMYDAPGNAASSRIGRYWNELMHLPGSLQLLRYHGDVSCFADQAPPEEPSR